MLDVGNQSTHLGVWSPSQLNGNQSWADKKGLNSLQILTYLLSAYRITADSRFLHTWKVCAVYTSVYGFMHVCVHKISMEGVNC